jgi:NAD(P)-dependent dehydrogenase (short-subunit alcohol dehydrogenase family)
MTSIPNINDWCPPFHHSPEGSTDLSLVTLPSPFIVVISGASEGIGLGIAISFAKAGASNIVISSRSAAKLETAKAQVFKAAKNPETKVLTIPCDVTNEEDVKSFSGQVAEKYGRVDCLVLNAGIGSVLVKKEDGKRDFPKGLVEAPLENVRDQFDLNVLGTWMLCRYFLTLVEKASGGPQSVVYIASAAAHCEYIHKSLIKP